MVGIYPGGNKPRPKISTRAGSSLMVSTDADLSCAKQTSPVVFLQQPSWYPHFTTQEAEDREGEVTCTMLDS